MLAQAILGFFLLLWRESRERAWPQSYCSLCTPTHSSGLASTIRNVERVARDTTREGWDGGAAHPRAGDTAANRRNDVRECLSRRQDASFYGNKTLSLLSHTHTHTRAPLSRARPRGGVWGDAVCISPWFDRSALRRGERESRRVLCVGA
jgi:hypothetical protein